MMHPISPTDYNDDGDDDDDNVVNPLSLKNQSSSLLLRHADDNDNGDEEQLRGGTPPALASTSSSSSCCEVIIDSTNNNNKIGGEGSVMDDSSLLINSQHRQQQQQYHHHGGGGNRNYIGRATTTTTATMMMNQRPPPYENTPLPVNNNNNINGHYNHNNNNIGQPITPLHNIPYVHGGYAAAAPLFVTHSKFASVLKRLLPSAYVELKGLLQRGGGNGSGNDDDNNNNSSGGGRDLLREYSVNNDLIDHSSTTTPPRLVLNRRSSSITTNISTNSHHHNNCNNNNYSTINPNNNNNQQQQQNINNNNISITDPVKIMKWAENNPIVSAFGIWNSDNGRRTKRFMQGVVVIRQSQQQQEQQEQEQKMKQGGNEGGDGTSPVREGERERKSISLVPRMDNRTIGLDNNGGDDDKTKRDTKGIDNEEEEEEKENVIDEEHLRSLLLSLSTHSSASNEFDVFHRDRGNSSVVEAVTANTNNHGGGGGGGGMTMQQRLLRHHPHHHHQPQQQQQRKRETNSSFSSSSQLPPRSPPPPPSKSNSTRNSYYYHQSPSLSPPPPPGSTWLKGGGMSGPGGISSPRRKIPLPSDLPNSTIIDDATTTTTAVGSEHGSSSSSNNGVNTKTIRRRTRSRTLSLTNTSYDAYLNDTTTTTTSTTIPSEQQQSQTKRHYNKPAIEWDIFLDPQLVRLVDAALIVVDDLECKLRKIRMKRERIRQQKRKEREEKRLQRKKREEMMKRMRMNGGGFGAFVKSIASVENDSDDDSDDDDDDDMSVIDDDEDFDLLQSHTAAQVEVDRLVAQLMRRTIIAHGSMSQLVLEGLGWAPKYNFGRVVKCSREGTNLPSPQRRNGHHQYNNNYYNNSSSNHHHHGQGRDLTSLSFAESLSWDEEEEQRDFEALLDRRIHISSVTTGTAGGGATNTTTTGKGGSSSSSTTHHSKGMFMEKWLSLFAKSLSLLVRSTNSSSSSGGGETGEDGGSGNNDIVKLSSSSSLVSRRKKEKSADALLVKKKKKKKKSSITKKPEEVGLTSYLSSFFFNPDKISSIGNIDEEDSDNDDENDTDDDDDASEHLTNNDMFSPATTKKSTGLLGGLSSCGLTLCLGMDDDDDRIYCGTSTGQTSNSVFPLNPHASHQMARDIQRIHDVLGEPLRLVLDLKSRRVPPRVWSRLIDNLRSRGLIIEGIGSFDMDELRVIGKGCSYPLTPILFFHSVGDLQRACHANEVKKGDTVYFNGGSLMWKRSSIMEAAECGGCCGIVNDVDDENDIHTNSFERNSSTATAATTSARTPNAKGDYSFQPYAYPRSALSDWERVQCKSTIEDYRRHFDLKIGVYVQEFSISAEALDELTVFVNQHGDLYDQGIAFGGVNGVAVKNISGDGYWNQRYMGRSWDFNARPSKEMTPLKPEDHHLVQVAIQAGAWGQVGTIYEVNDEQTGALTVPPPREPCMHIGMD